MEILRIVLLVLLIISLIGGFADEAQWPLARRGTHIVVVASVLCLLMRWV